jgi:hypothetical protein
VKWQQGRSLIDGMIVRGELERVPASRAHADLLLAQSTRHMESAGAIAGGDAAGAYQLLYDAARKALAAILENQGLRATSKGGGHIAVREAVSAKGLRISNAQIPRPAALAVLCGADLLGDNPSRSPGN